MNAHLKLITTPANGDVDPRRFAGAHAAVKKHKVKRDIVRPKGHNREHAWILTRSFSAATSQRPRQ